MTEYRTKTWADGSGGGTPITAAELNRMESGIARVLGPGMTPPASPNVKDDEFDGTSSVTWTDTPTAPATKLINDADAPGCAIFVSTASTQAIQGIHQPVPGAYPYTITTRVADHAGFQNYALEGLFIAPASPTGASNVMLWCWAYNGGTRFDRWSGTLAGSFFNETVRVVAGRDAPMFFRMVVNSATSVDLLYSSNGRVWITFVSAYNPGFTPGVMGIAVSSGNNAIVTSGVFDFFRVT